MFTLRNILQKQPTLGDFPNEVLKKCVSIFAGQAQTKYFVEVKNCEDIFFLTFGCFSFILCFVVLFQCIVYQS